MSRETKRKSGEEREDPVVISTIGHVTALDSIGDPGFLPPADVVETPDAYLVEIELPGLGKDEIVIQAHGDELVVRGERRLDPAGRPASFHRLERRYGPFARTFRFAEEVDPDRIAAAFEDGLLRLDVPKAGARSATRVRVERENP